MDLQEKLNEITKEISQVKESIESLTIRLKVARNLQKQYLRLIEKAKALEKH